MGNPPFAGKETNLRGNGREYIKVLQSIWPHADGKTDLCAYFFLRSAEILRPQGTFGLIASKIIAQGVTRTTGLGYIMQHKSISLYSADVMKKWPAPGAAVVISSIHGYKGDWKGKVVRNGTSVSCLNSHLEDGMEVEPLPLLVQKNIGFQGCTIRGKHFYLTRAQKEMLIAKNPRNAERIFAEIGGDDANHSYARERNRHVIDFSSMSLEEAQKWPDLMTFLKDQGADVSAKGWWKYFRPRPHLRRALRSKSSCMVVCCSATRYPLFRRYELDYVFNHSLNVIVM